MQAKSHIPEQVKYFICNSHVDMEENIYTEFKGHDNLSMENINPNEIDQKTLRVTKKPISRTINCFLNTLQGGCIYLGILDSGKVKGIEMSEDQREHFMVNLKDTLSRFDPPVSNDDRIRVRFIPVLYLALHDDPEKAYNSFNKGQKSGDLLNHVHLIRSCKPCWCLKNTRMQQNASLSHPAYVIKLTIIPFDMKAYISNADPLNLKCIPLYRNEEGLSFIRGQASQRSLTFKEIFQKTRQNAKIVAKAVLEDRRVYLKALKEKHPVKAMDSPSSSSSEQQIVVPFSNLASLEDLINKCLNKKMNPTLNNSREESSSGVSLSSSPTSTPSTDTPTIISPPLDTRRDHFLKTVKSSSDIKQNGYNSFTKEKQRKSEDFPSSTGKYFAPRGKAPGSYSPCLLNFKPFGIFPGFDCQGVALNSNISHQSRRKSAHPERYSSPYSQTSGVLPHSSTERIDCRESSKRHDNFNVVQEVATDSLNKNRKSTKSTNITSQSASSKREGIKKSNIDENVIDTMESTKSMNPDSNKIDNKSPMSRLQRSLLILSGQSP